MPGTRRGLEGEREAGITSRGAAIHMGLYLHQPRRIAGLEDELRTAPKGRVFLVASKVNPIMSEHSRSQSTDADGALNVGDSSFQLRKYVHRDKS